MRLFWVCRRPSGPIGPMPTALWCTRTGGLQRHMLEAALPLLPESITHLGATVSPANPYSLSNALACGFTIRARREMYGGFDRYLLAKEL